MLSKALWVGLERHVVVPSGFSKEINYMKIYSYDSKYIGETNAGKRQVHETPHNMDYYKMDETQYAVSPSTPSWAPPVWFWGQTGPLQAISMAGRAEAICPSL